jgi:para-aminobenzoate synthetase/4-amino-4-deoxychorismate lyase
VTTSGGDAASSGDASSPGDAAPGPDRDRGLFETMLVAAGRPVGLDAHLDRLTASLREVFGTELPAAVAAETAAAAGDLALGRLRIDVTPAPDGSLRHAIRAETIDPAIFFPPRRDGADLLPVHPPAWDGAHKWADRDWLESLEAELGDHDVPIILADDDEVLEAGRANVFAVLDGALATPPVDDRILPGTARAAVLALAAELGVAAAERRLTLADLEAADDVFLTSSVRGIRPARTLAGRRISPAGDLTERLAHELRARWLSDDA